MRATRFAGFVVAVRASLAAAAALSIGACSALYTDIRPGDNGTYYLTRVRQGFFSAAVGELLWCQPAGQTANLTCRVVAE